MHVLAVLLSLTLMAASALPYIHDLTESPLSKEALDGILNLHTVYLEACHTDPKDELIFSTSMKGGSLEATALYHNVFTTPRELEHFEELNATAYKKFFHQIRVSD